jgi:protein-S-isoprenylcysteine O-methyltransferase Ste14
VWYSPLWAVLVAHAGTFAAAGVLAAAWCVAEYFARRSTFRQGAPRRPPATLDQGTYPFIAIALAVGMASTALAAITGIGGFLPPWTAYVGAGLMAVGLPLRAWALVTLGPFFTMPITILSGQSIVARGPYRLLRHPAYAGGVLTAVGLPLVFGTTIGFAVTLVACAIVYPYRIRIEERTLVERFGERYRDYSRRTWRLIPGLY